MPSSLKRETLRSENIRDSSLTKTGEIAPLLVRDQQRLDSTEWKDLKFKRLWTVTADSIGKNGTLSKQPLSVLCNVTVMKTTPKQKL